MKLVYDIKDKPSFPQLIIFAVQQLLAIMAATLVVPIIINGNANLTGDNAMSTSAALFGAGVGTLIYILFTRRKSPVFLGSSFAFIGSMTSAFAGAVSVAAGYAGLIIGAVLAGLVYVIEALSVILQVTSFKLTGKRIFKMSPIHHHFEMCGWSEKKIVMVFTLITAVLCALMFFLG